MKKAAIISLLFIFMLQCGIKTMIVVSFYARQDYISRNLCENRDKPELHCNGSCCLKKQLQAEEKNERQLPELLKGDNLLCYLSQADTMTFVLPDEQVFHQSVYTSSSYLVYTDGIFRPPPFF